MYTRPQLTRVGDAREVVLGHAGNGLDLDATLFIGHFEFEEEYPIDFMPSGD
jgi:hypothetical protein